MGLSRHLFRQHFNWSKCSLHTVWLFNPIQCGFLSMIIDGNEIQSPPYKESNITDQSKTLTELWKAPCCEYINLYLWILLLLTQNFQNMLYKLNCSPPSVSLYVDVKALYDPNSKSTSYCQKKFSKWQRVVAAMFRSSIIVLLH